MERPIPYNQNNTIENNVKVIRAMSGRRLVILTQPGSQIGREKQRIEMTWEEAEKIWLELGEVLNGPYRRNH